MQIKGKTIPTTLQKCHVLWKGIMLVQLCKHKFSFVKRIKVLHAINQFDLNKKNILGNQVKKRFSVIK